MSLATLLDEIRADLADMPEVRRVYAGVPESINQLPAIVVASMGARCWLASHGRANEATPLQCEHTIRVEMHIPRDDIRRGASQMNDIAPKVALRLYSGFVRDRFNGTMITAGDPRGTNAQGMLDYTVGPSKWADMDTYAMFCEFRLTTEEEVLP